MRTTLRPRAALLLLLPALALAAVACGDDDDSPATATTATTAASAPTSDAAGESEASDATTEPAATGEEMASSGETEASAESEGESSGEGEATGEPAEGEETGTEPAADDALALPTGPDGCTHVEPPTAGGDRRSYDAPPASGLPGGATGTVRMETSCGAITIELDREVGGAVTEAFAGLVRDGFYDGLTFHRVVPDFVLQGGDPEGTGGGGPGFEVTQAPPASYVYAKGDVAMAKLPSDPAGTAGSQFFIVVSPQGASALGAPGEQPLYAVVGHVLDEDSQQTIARIAALGVGDGAPVQPVWVWRATLEQG